MGRLFIKQGLNKKINEKKCKVFKSVISKNPVKKKIPIIVKGMGFSKLYKTTHEATVCFIIFNKFCIRTANSLATMNYKEGLKR